MCRMVCKVFKIFLMRKSYLFRYVVLCSKYLINVYYKPLQKKTLGNL